jgi:hypothetical protein
MSGEHYGEEPPCRPIRAGIGAVGQPAERAAEDRRGRVLTEEVAHPDGSERRHPLTLEGVQAAIRASWSLESCDPTDAAVWTPENPSRGQCAVTALVVHDLLGGQLLEAEVRNHDGSPQGFHYWNRLADVDVDLTRSQFREGEVIEEPQLIDRLPSAPWLAHEQYLAFRERVQAALHAGSTAD